MNGNNEKPALAEAPAGKESSREILQWIFNISSKTLSNNTTYVFRVGLNDGSSIDFRFGLR